jgi:hypothetical protein
LASLSEGMKVKQTKPEGFILALQATPRGSRPNGVSVITLHGSHEGVIPTYGILKEHLNYSGCYDFM